jgi:hypothetical protein
MKGAGMAGARTVCGRTGIRNIGIAEIRVNIGR